MNEYDLVYAAGFFDGEGSIMIKRFRVKSKGHYYLTYVLWIGVGQSGEKGKQICEWFKNDFGGSIDKRKKNQENHYLQMWTWIIASKKTYKFLEQILPYLKLKKEQARLGMEFQKEVSKNGSKSWYSNTEKITRFSYFETVKREMSFLNHREVREVSWMKP